MRNILTEKLSACGCQDDDAVIEVLLPILREISVCDARSEDLNYRQQDALKKMVGGITGVYYLILNLLDNEDIVEHGTAIRWVWLTEKGKTLLAELEAAVA